MCKAVDQVKRERFQVLNTLRWVLGTNSSENSQVACFIEINSKQKAHWPAGFSPSKVL